MRGFWRWPWVRAARRTSPPTPVAATVTAYERISRHYDPITSSGEGDRAALRLLPDVSRETQLAERTDLAALQAQLERHIPATGLSDEDAINRAFLLRVVASRLRASISMKAACQSATATAISTSSPISPTARRSTLLTDAEAYIARLHQMPRLLRPEPRQRPPLAWLPASRSRKSWRNAHLMLRKPASQV